MPAIKLLAGLGNPGAQYAGTRHNAGFWLVERYRHGTASHRPCEASAASTASSASDGARWLLMPETFMNRSGLAVGARRALLPDPAGRDPRRARRTRLARRVSVKLKLGGGTAGHNGLRDIAAVLGTPQFWRMRIGVGHPRTLELQQQVADFVLHPPRREEAKAIDDAIERGLDVLPLLFDGQTEAAMMKLHTTAGRSAAGTA